jgi:hypothetical protein
MRCFVALEEDLLMELWLLDPDLVAPFSRPSAKASLLTTELVEPVETLKERSLSASINLPRHSDGLRADS